MSTELEITTKKEHNPHQEDYCDEKGCNQLATVFITEMFGKRKYCMEHFKKRLYK